MYSRTVGDGPPVVLVHGYGVSSAYLLPLARALAGRCAVYVPDLPGHGRSEDPETPHRCLSQHRGDHAVADIERR